MAKDYFVINQGKIVYRYGHYTERDAEIFAQARALERPGREYQVMMKISSYKFKQQRKKNVKKS